MRTTRILVIASLALCACRSPDASRIGRPGDPGYVSEQGLGSSAAHAGPIEGDFAGAIFHVAFYQQPDAKPPLVGFEYGAYDAAHGDAWLHVALWAQERLPEVVDVASYRALSPDGQLEPAVVEFAEQRLRRASAGRLRLEIKAGHAELELTDLVWREQDAGDPNAVTHGRAEGDVAYQCYLYEPEPTRIDAATPSRELRPLPNAETARRHYAEDVEQTSEFCAALLRAAGAAN